MENKNESSLKLDFIDSLRGYAILAVLMVHASQNGQPLNSDLGNTILIKGARGVQLFFMASAITLFYSYYKRRNNEPFKIRSFFIRRFFRIAPMFYIAIVYYLFQKLHEGNNLFDLKHLPDILAAFTFSLSTHPYWVSAIIPGGWSVSVEVIFYFLLPILYLKIKNIQQAFNLFLIAIIVRVLLQQFFQAYPLINDPNYWNSFLIYYFPNQFPVFAIGIFLYFLIFEKKMIVLKNPFTIFLLMMILFFQMASAYDIFIPENISFSALLGCFIWYLSEFKNSILVNPIINFIGRISFSIYVVHFAIFYWLNHYEILDLFRNTYINYVFKFLIVSLISIIISIFFYYFIEVPFQKMGAKIIGRIKYPVSETLN